jgi:glycolate oxidase FAD binding subunit
MTSSRTLLADSLAAACSVLREGEAGDAIDGLVPAFVASPGDTSEAAALLRAAAAHDLAVVPRRRR